MDTFARSLQETDSVRLTVYNKDSHILRNLKAKVDGGYLGCKVTLLRDLRAKARKISSMSGDSEVSIK